MITPKIFIPNSPEIKLIHSQITFYTFVPLPLSQTSLLYYDIDDIITLWALLRVVPNFHHHFLYHIIIISSFPVPIAYASQGTVPTVTSQGTFLQKHNFLCVIMPRHQSYWGTSLSAGTFRNSKTRTTYVY